MNNSPEDLRSDSMTMEYFELLEKTKKTLRHKLAQSMQLDLEFAQLCKIIKSKRQYRLDLHDVVNMFSYYGIPIPYGKDWFICAQELQIQSTENPNSKLNTHITKLQNSSVSRTLIYLFSSTSSCSRARLYERLKILFAKCTPLEFKWCMRIIGQREELRELIGGEI